MALGKGMTSIFFLGKLRVVSRWVRGSGDLSREAGSNETNTGLGDRMALQLSLCQRQFFRVADSADKLRLATNTAICIGWIPRSRL